MKSLRRIYLGVGSNVGDRLQNLKAALEGVKQYIGSVVACSSVYESAAWGFTGPDFLNSCFLVETALSPAELLEAIEGIETRMGRIRNKGNTYQNRVLDLDVLLYEDLILHTPQLTIPHPKLQLRRFVLEPLWELAPEQVHPALQKTITQLLEACTDRGAVTKIHRSLTLPDQSCFSHLNFVVIEGNIGAGKTTLAHKIANDFNGKLVLEHFADNPFLPRFYEDRNRYAFPVEMSFLADRYQQFKENTSQFDLFTSFMVSDYHIFKSLIFAKITLQEEEFKLYRKIFNFMYQEVKKPDVYVYLHQPTEKLLENIQKRGRDYERNIPATYLDEVNKGYLEFLKMHTDLNVLLIDLSELDFVKSAADYQFIIDTLISFKR